MSAFVCDHIHIDALVTWAAEHGVSFRHNDEWHRVDHLNGQEIGAMLLRENERSVRDRYPDCGDDLPGRTDETVAGYRFQLFPCVLTSVEVIKLCRCLAYQSCETDDWEQTPSFALLQAIEHHAVNGLPGYEAAPWGISEESLGKLKHGNTRRLSMLLLR
jgi:hypothetical protein